MTRCYLNPSSGWADAAESLQSVLRAAADLDVEIVEANVSKLIIDANGSWKGILGIHNKQLLTKHVLLCTGAYTPKLLAETFPQE